jgi:hypothetical protein
LASANQMLDQMRVHLPPREETTKENKRKQNEIHGKTKKNALLMGEKRKFMLPPLKKKKE